MSSDYKIPLIQSVNLGSPCGYSVTASLLDRLARAALITVQCQWENPIDLLCAVNVSDHRDVRASAGLASCAKYIHAGWHVRTYSLHVSFDINHVHQR